MNNQKKKLGFLLYHRDHPTKFFQLEGKRLRWLLLYPSMLSVVLLIILGSLLLYMKSVKTNFISKTPSVISKAQVENSRIEDELKEAKTLNETLIKKLESTSTDALSSLALFRSTVAQKDLSATNTIGIDSKFIKSSPEGISLSFNIINQTKDGSKLSGHIFVLYQNENQILTYPIDAIGEGTQIIFSKGELFTTYRYRPSLALFSNLRPPVKGLFKIMIFSRAGDLLYKESIPSASLKTN